MINPVVIGEWFGCYRQGWGGTLTAESFAHPAKASRNLAKRIYGHMREEGWLKPGDTILDPFAGIGGFALDALIMGCHFIGIELERPFVDMGAGCECTGVSKADWVRFYGRLDRMRYSGERYICPRCIAEAKGILQESTAQVALFEHAKESLSYRRNSGKIPETKAHHYVGNLEAWAKLGLPGTAVLLQGDSRQLLTWNFAGGKVEACLTSPPFADTSHSDWHVNSSPERMGKLFENYKRGGGGMTEDQFRRHCEARQSGYGSSLANLGNMKEGDISACLSSPPYAQSVNADSHGIDWEKAGPATGNRKRGEGTQHEATLRAQLSYGASPGNLGAMREGSADAVCSSPPYSSGTLSVNDGIQWDKAVTENPTNRHQAKGRSASGNYGTTSGNLGNLPPGSLEAVADNCISSPPYEGSLNANGDGIDWTKARRGGHSEETGTPRSASRGAIPDGYGADAGNLGNSSGDTFWSASRQILSQLFLCIKPGGHAVFVVGNFIRGGKVVPFAHQWMKLCESVGFVNLHWHTAWKTERYGTQLNTDGGEEVDEVSRISFFRRLASRRGGETVSSEEVLCFLRP